MPVYETNDDLLDDNETTADMTTDILEQMQMEWDFFRDNEETKLEYLNRTKDQITEKLQTMNDGNPIGIEDYYDYLTGPGIRTRKIFSTELDENFLCESFNTQIKQMVKPGVKFSEKGAGGAACTISDTVSDINAFYDDFSQGGWQAFNQLFEPQNNIFGASLLTRQELAMRQQMAYETAKTEALANQGYYSQKECEEEGEDGICLKSKIITPGYVFAELAGKVAMADLDYLPNAGDLEPYSEEIGDTFLDRMFEELKGLFKMETSDTGPEPPADDPCAFLQIIDPALYESCKKLVASGDAIENAIKQSGIDYLKDIISLKSRTRNLNTATISMLDNLISVYNQTSALGCPVNPNQITAAQNLRTALQQENNRLSAEIAGLNQEIAEIQAMTDTTEVIARIQEVKSLYDRKEARLERRDAEDAQDNVAALLQAANQALVTCQSQIEQQQFFLP
ncbi:MAG: hypothetical protein Q8L57_02450 [bacterium]|nr:hypothetical protein [bacterium]